ncbi:hypothetical protein [Ignatzschineria cameli]|nr:hypothetical protein [Ignatzschineria cameli]
MPEITTASFPKLHAGNKALSMPIGGHAPVKRMISLAPAVQQIFLRIIK